MRNIQTDTWMSELALTVGPRAPTLLYIVPLFFQEGIQARQRAHWQHRSTPLHPTVIKVTSSTAPQLLSDTNVRPQHSLLWRDVTALVAFM